MNDNIGKEFRFNLLFVITLITGVIFIYSTYAWFSSSLNVIISDFSLASNSSDGLYISLDGVTWNESVDITENQIMSKLTESYPSHRTQWVEQLGPVSTVGVSDTNVFAMNFFTHKSHKLFRPNYNNTDKLDFYQLFEDTPSNEGEFVAFDIFLKNVTPSPFEDNIYLDSSTSFVNANPDESEDDSALNALRLGLVFTDVVSTNSSITNIQSAPCNGRCVGHIYEPNALVHSETSIKNANKHGVTLLDGQYYETYGMKNAGDGIMFWSGVRNNKVGIDNEYYGLQNTISSLDRPLFSMSTGVVKVRLYVWVEGQDIDIIEHKSDGYKVSVSIKFRKDHASLV